MTRKDNKRCWLCGGIDLEPDDRGVRCRACGATDNHVPKPGQNVIAEYRDYGVAPKGQGSRKSPSPSSSVRRQATKARSNI